MCVCHPCRQLNFWPHPPGFVVDAPLNARKPVTERKRLRTCSTSCPDLSNPEAGVFSKHLPHDSDKAAVKLSEVKSAVFHRSVSSGAFAGDGGSAKGRQGLDYMSLFARAGSMEGMTRGYSDSGLASLYEDDEGDDESQSRAKKYVLFIFAEHRGVSFFQRSQCYVTSACM